MSAVLFGSISTVADTSEIQRAAFNSAFEAHGLGWTWDREEYLPMLRGSGGKNRVAEYANARGEDVDAAAVHHSKSEIFRRTLAASSVNPRPGVVDTIKAAKDRGVKLGLVTTTSPENVSALLAALGPVITADDFDVIVDATDVDAPKPDKAAYAYALERLGEGTDGVVAIEDNVGGVEAATAAGLRCVAFPNENTAEHDFPGAERRVDRLDPDTLL